MLGTDHGLGARQAVSVLLRSRGSGNSARYSRNPRRYGQQVVACGAGFQAGPPTARTQNTTGLHGLPGQRGDVLLLPVHDSPASQPANHR